MQNASPYAKKASVPQADAELASLNAIETKDS